MSKQTDSYTDTFLSHTALPDELCVTGLQGAKGYTLMNLLRAGNRADAKTSTLNFVQSYVKILLNLTFFRCDDRFITESNSVIQITLHF